jgi:hypothetical protein
MRQATSTRGVTLVVLAGFCACAGQPGAGGVTAPDEAQEPGFEPAASAEEGIACTWPQTWLALRPKGGPTLRVSDQPAHISLGQGGELKGQVGEPIAMTGALATSLFLEQDLTLPGQGVLRSGASISELGAELGAEPTGLWIELPAVLGAPPYPGTSDSPPYLRFLVRVWELSCEQLRVTTRPRSGLDDLEEASFSADGLWLVDTAELVVAPEPGAPGRLALRGADGVVPVWSEAEREGWVHIRTPATGMGIVEGWVLAGALRQPTSQETSHIEEAVTFQDARGILGGLALGECEAPTARAATIAAGTPVMVSPGGPAWGTIVTADGYLVGEEPIDGFHPILEAPGISGITHCQANVFRSGDVNEPLELLAWVPEDAITW